MAIFLAESFTKCSCLIKGALDLFIAEKFLWDHQTTIFSCVLDPPKLSIHISAIPREKPFDRSRFLKKLLTDFFLKSNDGVQVLFIQCPHCLLNPFVIRCVPGVLVIESKLKHSHLF